MREINKCFLNCEIWEREFSFLYLHTNTKRGRVTLLCRLPALAEATYRDHFCRLVSSCVVVGVIKNFCHIFLWNHTGQLPDIWHRASVWRTVSCNAFLNLRHVHFLFYATLNIVDMANLLTR